MKSPSSTFSCLEPSCFILMQQLRQDAALLVGEFQTLLHVKHDIILSDLILQHTSNVE